MGVPLLMALLAAGGVLLIVWALLGTRSSDPVQARLTQLGTLEGVTSLEEIELQQPIMDRTLRPLMRRLSGIGTRLSSPQRIGRTESKLAEAGYPYGLRTLDFMGLKVVVALLTSGLAFLLFGLAMGNPGTGFMLAAAGLAIGFFIPDYWLSRRIGARQKAILLAIPDTLDLLTISVKAGLGFDAALGKVVEKTEGPLTDEFRRTLAEVRIGKARRDALREMVARTNVPALTNFISAIIQAEQLGVAIARVLEVQSEQLRIQRRQRAEEMAAKAPIKMLFPLVGCIFPSMFIVILGPAIILIITGLGAPTSRPGAVMHRATADATSVRRLGDDAVVVNAWRWASPSRQRFLGLMGRRSLDEGEGLFLATSSIHMFFMRFAIDALFVTGPGASGARRVVGIREHLPPWRGLVLPVRGARGVIELPAGTLRTHEVRIGDEVVFEPDESLAAASAPRRSCQPPSSPDEASRNVKRSRRTGPRKVAPAIMGHGRCPAGPAGATPLSRVRAGGSRPL